MSDALKEAHEIIEHFKHYGPGPHKGSGTPQAVHAGFKKMGGAGVLAAVSGMERTRAHEYVARLRAANPKTPAEKKPDLYSETTGDAPQFGKPYTSRGRTFIDVEIPGRHPWREETREITASQRWRIEETGKDASGKKLYTVDREAGNSTSGGMYTTVRRPVIRNVILPQAKSFIDTLAPFLKGQTIDGKLYVPDKEGVRNAITEWSKKTGVDISGMFD